MTSPKTEIDGRCIETDLFLSGFSGKIVGVIDRDEIAEVSRVLGVNTSDVQRDYLYGWLLAGLYGDSSSPRDRLVLKGGNAFRKGYFVSTRFSGDLDLAAPMGLDPGLLLRALNDVCRMIQARTGVTFDLDRNRQVEQRSIDGSKSVHKFALYFNDFSGKPSKMTISMRIDVTEYGRLYLPIRQRQLIHPYSDRTECATTIEVVSLEEALADKLKCLLQRHSSKDLFDLVYSIFINEDVEVDKTTIIKTFLRKTIFEPSPQAALKLLLAVPFEVMRAYWNKIVCSESSLLNFTDAVSLFKEELTSLFSSFRFGDSGQLAFFPPELRTPIMEAGRTQTLLRVVYNGAERLVEPYALTFKWRKGGVGQEYLYVYDRTGGHSGPGIKSLFNWKIQSLEATDIKFEPQFEVELAKAGEYGARTTFNGRNSSVARSAVAGRGTAQPEVRYRVRCVSCQRVFPRSTASASMRPHQDNYGNRCLGRRGVRL